MEERKPELHDKRDRLQRPSRDSCFAETQIGRFREQTICESLRASGGNAGGQREYRLWDKVGALCGTDWRWVQQVMQGKIVVVRVTH